MALRVLDSATRAAVAAATSQQTQLEALLAPWAGANITARLFTTGGTLLRTLTLPAPSIAATTPRSFTLGAHLADAAVATGTPGVWRFRTAGGLDVFEVDAGTGGASINHVGAIKTLCTPTLQGVVITAQASLQLTSPPTWLAGQAVGEWRAISGTAFPYGDGILNAWGVLVAVNADLYSPANGGHEDSSDNGVYRISLSANSPAWSTVAAPSAVGDRLSAENYYADGKPTSRHGYHHAFWVPQRNRIMLMAGFGNWVTTGGSTEAIDVVDGFNPDTGLWDAAGTWATLGYDRGQGQGMDPLTGNVWTNGGWLWTQATNTWSQPGTQTISGGGIRQPWAFDTSRNQFFCLQNGDGWGFGSGVNANIINRTTGARTAISFNSSAALTQFTTDAGVYAGMAYDSANDQFLWYSGQVAGRVYVITPNAGTTWDMSFLSATGATLPVGPSGGAGINGRLREVAIGSLKFIVCMPSAAAGLYALRVA